MYFLSSRTRLLLLIKCSLVFVYLLVLYKKIGNENQQQQLLKQQQQKQSRYVVYECDAGGCGGWADRLKGIFTAYALSLLTNRSLIINMTHPCRLDLILRPNKIKWNEDIVETKILSRQQLISFAYKSPVFERFKCITLEDLIGEYEQSRIVSIKTGASILNQLSANPNFALKLEKLGYNPKKFKVHYLMKSWYDKLFKLHPRLTLAYRRFIRRAKPTSEHKLVCVQIRVGKSFDSPFTERRNSIEFWKFVNRTFLQQKSANKNDHNHLKLFITSDQNDIKLEAEEVFGKRMVVFYADSDAHLDAERAYSRKIDRIMLDFHSLRNCDAGVVSQSGFGLLGLWNRALPGKDLYVYTNQKNIRENYWNRFNLNFVKVDDLDQFYYE